MKVTCSICKDVFSVHSEVYAVECGHLFHRDCINKWCEASVTCPHCRLRLRETPLRLKFHVKNRAEKNSHDSQYDQLMQDLHFLLGEEKVLKVKYEEMEGKLGKVRNEASEAESKAKKLKFDVTVWKQQCDCLKKNFEEIKHLKMENKALETRISSFESLEKLLYGSVSDMNEVLVGVPTTISTIEELCKFTQVMRHKLKTLEESYNKRKTKLINLIEKVEKECMHLEKNKNNVNVLNKSIQTDELLGEKRIR